MVEATLLLSSLFFGASNGGSCEGDVFERFLIYSLHI